MKQTAYLVGLAAALVCMAPSIGRAQCLGDFNGDGKVTIDELMTVVSNTLNGCQVSPRFVDNGDGTVTDHQTGLMWEKKVDVPPDGPANVHDEASCYLSWSNTGTAPDGGVFTDFLATLNNCVSTDSATVTGGFAEHCDWRLPTITELQGIYDTTAPGCGVIRHPCVFPELEPMTAGYHWSSTSDATDQTEVWSVNFDLYLGGGPDHIVKGAAVCARAVRNAP